MLHRMADCCPFCAGPLVSITFRLEGEDVEMRSCSTCDVRFYRRCGEDVELAGLIGHEPARQPSLR
jgi:hypothetical protein